MSELLTPGEAEGVPEAAPCGPRETPSVAAEMEAHLDNVVKALVGSRDVVPFLGAGVNVFERPADVAWQLDTREFLPSATELAEHLKKKFHWPREEQTSELLRVSQYIAARNGTGPLYEELHKVFDNNYPLSSLHSLLARLPALIEEITGARRYQLILTTNYDDALERAFVEAGEEFDVVSYLADHERNRGKFLHRPFGEDPKPIRFAQKYMDVTRETRTVILKLHGAIDRELPPKAKDSFVITEDHYVDYLTVTEPRKFLPRKLAQELTDSHILFLGYGMADWNLRVLLHRMWGGRTLKYTSWSIQEKASPLDQAFWEKRNLDVLEMDLCDYVPLLRERIEAELPPER